MIRLVLIGILCILFPYTKEICDYYYPVKGAPYDNIWDNLKHFYYLICILLGILVAKAPIKVRWEHFVQLGFYIFIWGELLPAMTDKWFSNDDPEKHWYDFFYIGIAVYGGLFHILPKWHEVLTVSFINLITFRLVDGGKIYQWTCQKLR